MVEQPSREQRRREPSGALRNQRPDAVALLRDMVRALRLENTHYARTAAKIATRNDQRTAAKLARRLASAYYQQQLAPDRFLSYEEGLDGAFRLGHMPGRRALGLTSADMNRHVFISGQAGTGKSNLLINLFRQAASQGVHCVYFDRKGDVEHLARQGVESYQWRHLRINPLCPPSTRVDAYEFRNDFVKAFAEANQLMVRGSSLFLRGVDELYRRFEVYERWPRWDWRKHRFPTLADLLALFRSKDFACGVRGHGRESLFGIVDKLESLLIELDPIVACQRGVDVKRFYSEGRAMNYNLDGLAVEYQNFLIVAELIRLQHMFRAHGPRGRLNALLFFDESKGLLSSKHESFLVKDLVAKVREYGIGLVCADQIPSEVSQFFFSNIGTLVMFRHSDGRDLQRVRFASGATLEQSLENYSLQPGDAVVRSMRFRDLHRIQTSFTPAEKFITREELDHRMAARLRDFHRDVILAIASNPPRDERQSDIDDLDKRFLTCAAQLIDQPSSTVYKALGLNQSAGYRIKQRLLRQGRLTEVTSNLGEGGRRTKHLVPSPEILERLGLTLPEGKGKALHKHLQHEIRDRAAAAGAVARIEDNRGTREAVDVGVEHEGRSTAYEVCVSSKPRTEVSNIGKALRMGFDTVILTFVSKRTLEKTRALAEANVSPEQFARTRFLMVNEAIRTLEVRR